MYNDLLLYICEKKIYAEIRGITSPGTELVLNVVYIDGDAAYKQMKTIFTPSMVSCILFHSHGATITLKSNN